MQTQAKLVRALLLASGLLRYLWEKAIYHLIWLQNQTPSHALNGKTPYEKRYKKKPHLADIQEFGAAAYVKNLNIRELES